MTSTFRLPGTASRACHKRNELRARLGELRDLSFAFGVSFLPGRHRRGSSLAALACQRPVEAFQECHVCLRDSRQSPERVCYTL